MVIIIDSFRVKSDIYSLREDDKDFAVYRNTKVFNALRFKKKDRATVAYNLLKNQFEEARLRSEE